MPAEPHYPSLSNLRRIWNSRLCWFRTPTKLQALSGGRFRRVGVFLRVSAAASTAWSSRPHFLTGEVFHRLTM